MAEEQVFHPEEIAETPFPGQDVPVIVQQTQSSGDVTTPTTTKTSSFPTRKIATELIGTALNTRSKKILQEFELTQSGGFKIGNYKEGVSGEILITPSGIVTKDKAGLVTIAMYNEDGSGVFKGSIQAGSIITGLITVGDNRVIIDGESQQIIVNDGTKDRVLIGYQEGGF